MLIISVLTLVTVTAAWFMTFSEWKDGGLNSGEVKVSISAMKWNKTSYIAQNDPVAENGFILRFEETTDDLFSQNNIFIYRVKLTNESETPLIVSLSYTGIPKSGYDPDPSGLEGRIKVYAENYIKYKAVSAPYSANIESAAPPNFGLLHERHFFADSDLYSENPDSHKYIIKENDTAGNGLFRLAPSESVYYYLHFRVDPDIVLHYIVMEQIPDNTPILFYWPINFFAVGVAVV